MKNEYVIFDVFESITKKGKLIVQYKPSPPTERDEAYLTIKEIIDKRDHLTKAAFNYILKYNPELLI